MAPLDWIVMLLPMAVVLFFALWAQRYQRGVADFLSAGRVGGRYVMSVASEMAGMGLITVVAATEAYYHSGMGYAFWEMLYLPVGFILGLTGFCHYRFRETRAMTMGQFFEMRFSRSFRVTAAIIQSLSGIINYAIFPAVGARFLVYYLNLPQQVECFGWYVPTFQLVMALFLGLALVITTLGGQVTVLVTDCVQGLFSYPMYLLILGFILWKFSWSDQVMPVLEASAPGHSMLNPLEIQNLRDFNAFYVFVGISGMFLGRLSWGGTQGFNSSARNAHEARMGILLGTWRAQFYKWMSVILGIAALVYLNGEDFATEAHEVRQSLAHRVALDVAPHQAAALQSQFDRLEPRHEFALNYDSKESWNKENADPFLAIAKEQLSVSVAGGDERGLSAEGRSFQTIYRQMSVSVALRHLLPEGLVGIFCALMIFLLISTDCSYLHSWGSILVQDFVLPLRRRPITPKAQLRALRFAIAGVAAFAFIFSSTFAQVDFILMFFAITGAFWAGAGAIITLGLYWSRGTTQGAFAALIAGALIALSGFAGQKYWTELYALLVSWGWQDDVSLVLETVTAWCAPYIEWKMNPDRFPVNSQEILFITNASSLLVFILVSLKTCKVPFNMDRLLHRGIYRLEAAEEFEQPRVAGVRRFLRERVLGIDHLFSKADRVLAYAAFIWSFVYVFVGCFLFVLVWNLLSPWPLEWWGTYFYLTIFIGTAVLGIIFSVWFTWGGIRDLRALFHDLSVRREVNVLDNGVVDGEVSAADRAAFATREHAGSDQRASQDRVR